MSFIRITESESNYNNLEKMQVAEILFNMNREDKTVAESIEKAIPQIDALIQAIVDKMLMGGRLFYIGAGTSGRLGVLDASECPPTFGVPSSMVTGIIAGGKKALTEAVEFAEDDREQGWLDLQQHAVKENDMVVGIAASGTTAYVISALQQCKLNNIVTGSICCNPGAPISQVADHPIEVITGPEFVTGSTRMKSGTAQKMILNMISTAVMIQLGRVEGNKMVNMQLTNEKLVERGVNILMEKARISDHETARALLLKYGSVKKAIENNRS